MPARIDRDLFKKLDSVRTPCMDDFEICHDDAHTISKEVKLIALRKKFRVTCGHHTKEIIWYHCSMSPYFENKTTNIYCPFRIRYKFDAQTEEFYLMDFDEMHNHPLEWDTALIPFPKKFNHFCKFPTANFDD